MPFGDVKNDMLNTTFMLEKIDGLEPLNDPTVFATPIPPIERVRSFSHEAFEEFIAEWAIACTKVIYKDVYRIGGSGDKGRDVIGEYNDGTYDYFQCKKYDKKLSPSQYWLEFGKLCYYTYSNAIPTPKKYYVVASQGIGSTFEKLIKNNHAGIREGLIQNWYDKCEKHIIKDQPITLDADLEKYILNFDFSIIDYYSIEKIIEEHRHTHYFYFRFGGSLKPKRTVTVLPPPDVADSETNYVNKIFETYKDLKATDIHLLSIHLFPELLKEFNRHRTSFYSAESLKRCIREIFINDNEFDILKKEMHSGIVDYMEDYFESSHVKLNRTLHESTKVNLSVSIVDRDLHFVTNEDKKGICHHLANDNLLDWKVNV